MTTYTRGDTYGPNEDGFWTSGIHAIEKPIEKSHWQQIECYGRSKKEAELLRDNLLIAFVNHEWRE